MKIKEIYIINYKCDSSEVDGPNAWLKRSITKSIFYENMANAIAKMLIFLIENKLLEVKNV